MGKKFSTFLELLGHRPSLCTFEMKQQLAVVKSFQTTKVQEDKPIKIILPLTIFVNLISDTQMIIFSLRVLLKSFTDHDEGALDWQHLHHHLVWDIVLLGTTKKIK